MKCGLFNDPFDYYSHIGSFLVASMVKCVVCKIAQKTITLTFLLDKLNGIQHTERDWQMTQCKSVDMKETPPSFERSDT